MGKRTKNTKKPPAKRRMTQPLPKLFDCPLCGRQGSCEVTIEKKKAIACVKCCVCGEQFHTRTTHLSEAIDVYSEWVDECERTNS